MKLEAISPSCWSDLYVLKLDGRPWGEYRGRWFSECVDIYLTGAVGSACEKSVGWGSRFRLTDAATGEYLGSADRSGMFTIAWDLRLSSGSARLVSAGWFNTGYRVVQGGRILAEINRVGLLQRRLGDQVIGWLRNTDLLFIGLIYHTILRRNAAAD